MDPTVIKWPQILDEENYPILWEEVEVAVKTLKMGNSAGVDNAQAELIQAGGKAMIDTRYLICSRGMGDPSYHTPKVRQLAAVPEIQNHQPS